MKYDLRPYQKEGIDAHEDFLRSGSGNGLSIFATGSGKSIIIAETIKRMGEPTLILQPSKEILVQNFGKYTSHGFDASIYSASLKSKVVSQATFATIGSIQKTPELFKGFPYIIVDEAHVVNAKGGMYQRLIGALDQARVIGLTATPYRLHSNSFGSELRFLTRTRPRIFNEVLYITQNKDLFDQGFLCPLKYYDIPGYDRDKLKANSNGSDYKEESISLYQDETHFQERLLKVVRRLKEIRKNAVIFTRFVKEAEFVKRHIEGVEVVTGDTPDAERDRILKEWKEGKIWGVANVGVLTTGVDYPELETVVLARVTKSLSLYYQMVGRGVRIHPSKPECWVVDMTQNFKYFGAVEDLHIGKNRKGLWEVSSNGRPLTNVILK